MTCRKCRNEEVMCDGARIVKCGEDKRSLRRVGGKLVAA